MALRGPVPLDPKVNPAYLKLDLYCRGLRLHESARRDEEGRPILRTRAGLGSGLELVLPHGLWTNAPVVEAFAASSPYELRRDDAGRHAIVRGGEEVAAVRLAPRPAWYDALTSSGRPLRLIGTLQGTYLGIYPGRTCDFWLTGRSRAVKENCRFCSVGLNLGHDDADGKSLDEVMEVVRAARRQSGVTYVDLNAGHADDLSYLDMLEPFVRRIKRETGLLVGLQAPPHPDFERYRALRRAGLNRVSFCFEIFDRELFASTCPGKARAYGLDRFLDAITACVALRREGPRLEPWVVNGELIAGLEPPQGSIAAIEWLTARGAIPTACVFRPLRGTDMSRARTPPTDEMVPVFAALWERCMEARLPIGMAPNVNVSLVLLPEECRWLVQDEAVLRRHARAERALAWKRRAFGAWFRSRQGIRRAPARAGA